MPDIAEIIQAKFKKDGIDGSAQIPYIKANLGSFSARLHDDGVEVDNLGNYPFLPWAVFRQAVYLMRENQGRAKKGSVNYKLGEKELPLNSIEGRIASRVYGKQLGSAVFRRITPIACLLIWAGVCENSPGQLHLCPGIPIQVDCEESNDH